MFRNFMTSTLAFVSLFAVADQVRDTVANKNNSDAVNKLNQSSKGSIASSWFELPDSCKAKSFNADPVIIDREAHSALAIQIYSSLS